MNSKNVLRFTAVLWAIIGLSEGWEQGWSHIQTWIPFLLIAFCYAITVPRAPEEAFGAFLRRPRNVVGGIAGIVGGGLALINIYQRHHR